MAAFILVVIMGVALTAAQDLIHPDGRLNQIAHFGGDAFYCVDADKNPTNDLEAFEEDGGFLLLDANGQELWFVAAADVAEAVATLEADSEPVLIASGQGSYGPVELYVYLAGDEPEFVFIGYDEHGKSNSLTFRGCSPVGPGPDPDQPEAAEDPTPTATPFPVA